MFEFLSLGFLIGMSHAFEADHLAAVSALVSRNMRGRDALRHGALWGLGHTVTLLAFAGIVITLQVAINQQLALSLEFAVGIMLVALGIHVLYRLHKDRVHFHRHKHGEKPAHLHVHSHADDPTPHEDSSHQHSHRRTANIRSLLVGMMHGLAGSAALVLIAASALSSPSQAFIYVAVFGIGSILGMAVLSAAIAFPLSLSARFLTRINGILRLGIGALTIFIGGSTIWHSALGILA